MSTQDGYCPPTHLTQITDGSILRLALALDMLGATAIALVVGRVLP